MALPACTRLPLRVEQGGGRADLTSTGRNSRLPLGNRCVSPTLRAEQRPLFDAGVIRFAEKLTNRRVLTLTDTDARGAITFSQRRGRRS